MAQIKESRGDVHVEFNSIDGLTVRKQTKNKKQYKKWAELLFALGTFLKKYSRPEEEVHVYAYECEQAGGLRILELDFTQGNAGACYQRGTIDQANVIFAAELFLCTHGIKPTRPQGWESCLN